MRLGDNRQPWVKLDVAEQVGELISDKNTSSDWEKPDPELSEDIDKLASKIVNNRITEPVGAIAYGKDDAVAYNPERQGDKKYNRSLMANMINAESFATFLTDRLLVTVVMALVSTGLFYVLAAIATDTSWGSGMIAFLASVLVVLVWMLGRVIRVQTSSGIGGFFRHGLNVSTITSLSVAMPFLFKILDDFISELDDFQKACTSQSDQLAKVSKSNGSNPTTTHLDFNDNANAMAKTMIAWAIGRRAAQYLSFQPTNLRDKYERNGVSLAKTAVGTITYYVLLGFLLLVVLVLSLMAPAVLETIRPGTAETMMTFAIGDTTFQTWPVLQAIFISVTVLILSHGDIATYKEDRMRVTLALDDFWRRGKIRTAQQIAALRVPFAKLYDEAAEAQGEHAIYPTSKEMIRDEVPANTADYSDVASTELDKWKVSLHWKDELVKTDPIPELMKRYIKFLDTVGSRSVVHTRMSDTPAGVERQVPSGVGADARPRTRALATLTRREIWHP